MKSLIICLFTIIGVISHFQAHGQEEENISDLEGKGTGTVTWKKDKIYVLNGIVFVNPGDVLTIESGTVIKGKGGAKEISALVVAAGAKIVAKGTYDAPIIFTAYKDDLKDPYDIPRGTMGLWGGVIILGNAPARDFSSLRAEGIERLKLPGLSSKGKRGEYGGKRDKETSGIMTYVSIRHAGVPLNENKETSNLAGLTLAGVGSKTILDFVEVIFSAGHGISFMGGLVNAKHLSSIYNGQSAYNFEQGYYGKGQFWLGAQTHKSEFPAVTHVGGDKKSLTKPTIVNATFLSNSNELAKVAMAFSEGAGGRYYNCIFQGFESGVKIEYTRDEEFNSFNNLNKDLILENNLFWDVANNKPSDVFSLLAVDDNAPFLLQDSLSRYFELALNRVGDPGFEESQNEEINYIPKKNGEAYQNLNTEIYSDEYFNETCCSGTSECLPSDRRFCWPFSGSATYKYCSGGFFTERYVQGSIETDTWRSNLDWYLNGLVFVKPNETLTIEPGTVIRGRCLSALIVLPGATLIANGSSNSPIIFTSEDDDPNHSNPGIKQPGSWGGLIIMGNSPINGTGTIFGHSYGGTEPADNSGILNYVSIRYAGESIPGGTTGALTLAGVGSDTQIDSVEVCHSGNKGVEFLGGTVNTKHLASVFNVNTDFSFNKGYQGFGQYWFSLQGNTHKHHAVEINGTTGRLTRPQIYNATIIGDIIIPQDPSMENYGVKYLGNGAGKLYSSIFVDFGFGTELNYSTSPNTSSFDHLGTSNLDLQRNIYQDIRNVLKNSNNALLCYDVNPTPPATSTHHNAFRAVFNSNNNLHRNSITSGSVLENIDRSQSQLLQPYPSSASPPVYPTGPSFPSSPVYFINSVNYIGAFEYFADGRTWLHGWSCLDKLRVLKPINSSFIGKYNIEDSMFRLEVPSKTNEKSKITLEVFDQTDKQVYKKNDCLKKGSNVVNFSLKKLQPGIYKVLLTQKQAKLTEKKIIIPKIP